MGAKDKDLPVIEWDEIMRHSMQDDAWVVIDGVIYDITQFIKDESGHPGGADIPLVRDAAPRSPNCPPRSM